MGEELPDGTIQGYSNICKICGRTISCNVQGGSAHICTAKPLTKKESAWLARLEKVLSSCPSDRLECYTIGDNNVTFYDRHVLNKYELSLREGDDMWPMCDASGALLRTLYSNFGIVSAAG